MRPLGRPGWPLGGALLSDHLSVASLLQLIPPPPCSTLIGPRTSCRSPLTLPVVQPAGWYLRLATALNMARGPSGDGPRESTGLIGRGGGGRGIFSDIRGAVDVKDRPWFFRQSFQSWATRGPLAGLWPSLVGSRPDSSLPGPPLLFWNMETLFLASSRFRASSSTR